PMLQFSEEDATIWFNINFPHQANLNVANELAHRGSIGYVNCEASWILRDCKEKTLMHISLGRAQKSLNCGPPFQWLTCSIIETPQHHLRIIVPSCSRMLIFQSLFLLARECLQRLVRSPICRIFQMTLLQSCKNCKFGA
ncbi:hypothetical protein HID58_069385, partial [Brassica napus]